MFDSLSRGGKSRLADALIAAMLAPPPDRATTAAFNKANPLCDDPSCFACNLRRSWENGTSEPAAKNKAVDAAAAPVDGSISAVRPSATEHHLALVRNLEDAGQALGAAILALIRAAGPESVARAHARAADDALSHVNRLTTRAINAL